jgi:hypothetical protein
MATTARIYRNHGTLVAGAGAEGHGVLVGWSGRGDMTRGKLIELANDAGIPADWVPSPKQAATQLTRSIRAAAGSLYTAEAPRRTKDDPETLVSRWLLVTRSGSGFPILTPGGAYGEIALIADLHSDGRLEITTGERREALELAVRKDFADRCASESYVAADVTAWLSGVLRDRLAAVRYGGCWYVPRVSRAQATALVNAFRVAWGRDWIYPALPVATGPELALGVAQGLISEVEDTAAALEADRTRARQARTQALAINPETKLAGDIGAAAAESYMMRFRAVGDRILNYAAILGAENVEHCRSVLFDGMIVLDVLLETAGAMDLPAEWAALEIARRRAGILD